jgi:hypothetical protein
VSAFLDSADSRETSQAIIEAIWHLARAFGREPDEPDETETVAVRIWEAPREHELICIWDRVTCNGHNHSTRYQWGVAGDRWADSIRWATREEAQL